MAYVGSYNLFSTSTNFNLRYFFKISLMLICLSSAYSQQTSHRVDSLAKELKQALFRRRKNPDLSRTRQRIGYRLRNSV